MVSDKYSINFSGNCSRIKRNHMARNKIISNIFSQSLKKRHFLGQNKNLKILSNEKKIVIIKSKLLSHFGISVVTNCTSFGLLVLIQNCRPLAFTHQVKICRSIT